MPLTKRLFVAVQLDTELLSSVNCLKNEAMHLPKDRAFRWTSPEYLHLTLVFLGDTNIANIPEIYGLLDHITSGIEKFSLIFRGLGCFPNMNRPRVFWMGLEEAQALRRLYNKTIRALSGIVAIERPRFSPHVTIARINNYAKDETISSLSHLISAHENTIFGKLKVASVKLFESDLQPGGPVYKMIHQSMLK